MDRPLMAAWVPPDDADKITLLDGGVKNTVLCQRVSYHYSKNDGSWMTV